MFNKLTQYFGISSQDGSQKKYEGSLFCTPKNPVWSDRNYEVLAEEAFVKNVIAYRCITMIAQAAGTIKVKICSKTGYDKVPILEHPILDLLARPNPIYGYTEFMESIYYYRLIAGNAFILGLTSSDRSLKELMVLRPDKMSIMQGTGFFPAGYRYSINNKYYDYPVDQNTGLSNILHIKNFHPTSELYGLSPVDAASYSIDQHNQTAAWNQALLQNGGRPSGILTVPSGAENMHPDNMARLRYDIENLFTGPHNAGRPMILPIGMQWKEISISPKDMDFIASKHSAARDIALALGVPPQLLGIPGDNTYSNLVEARIALWEQTVLPLVESTFSALNNWFKHFFNGEWSMYYDIEEVLPLAEKRYALFEKLEKATFMTVNEKRAVFGLKPLKRGDK